MTQDNMLGLQGRTALITGGARGIGAACAAQFVQAGANVALIDRDAAQLYDTVAQLTAAGADALACAADVCDETAIERAVQQTIDRFGSVDILVNNAGGVAPVAPARTWEIEPSDWDRLVELNLRSVYLCCRAVVPRMLDAERPGVIVNIGAALGVRHASHLSAYGAAKAAVAHLTQTLAVELGRHGIRVNCVAPAFTSTPAAAEFVSAERRAASIRSIPLHRIAEPADIAGPVVLLASGMAGFVTGQTLLVDGGLTCMTLREPRGWNEGETEVSS